MMHIRCITERLFVAGKVFEDSVSSFGNCCTVIIAKRAIPNYTNRCLPQGFLYSKTSVGSFDCLCGSIYLC